LNTLAEKLKQTSTTLSNYHTNIYDHSYRHESILQENNKNFTKSHNINNSKDKSKRMSLDRSNLYGINYQSYDAYKTNQFKEEVIRQLEFNNINDIDNQWYTHKEIKKPEFIPYSLVNNTNKINFHHNDINMGIKNSNKYSTLNNKWNSTGSFLAADIIA